MKWYIVYSTPGYENKVKERILARAAETGLSASFGRIEVPSEEVMEVKNGKKIATTRRLFPGYVFVEMEFDDKVWHLVRKTPNVTTFVGGSETRPAPLKQREIDEILNRAQQTVAKPAPKVAYGVGEVVRVASGPFKDFNGSVDSVDYDKGKLKVMVTVFGRDTPLEIGFSEVEKI